MYWLKKSIGKHLMFLLVSPLRFLSCGGYFMHYLCTVKIVIIFTIIVINNFLVKTISSQENIGDFFLQCQQLSYGAWQPISFQEAHTPLVLCWLWNNFSRELQLASDPVMIIIIFLIVPLAILTSQSDDSWARLEDYFHHASISFWVRVHFLGQADF